MVPELAGMLAIAAALAVGLCGLGAGIAEGRIGKAVIKVMVEKPEFLGTGLLMTVIPESIAIFGLVVALIIPFLYGRI